MRVAILSDIHGNLEALRAVLEGLPSAGQHGSAPDAVWCLGDLVGYGPDPNACVEMVRDSGWPCVAGNHDLAGSRGAGLEAFNPTAATALEWTRTVLTTTNSAFLASLPPRLDTSAVTLVHGSPRDPVWEYIASTQTARENYAFFDGPLCLVGHTHVPAIFRQTGRGVFTLVPTPGEPVETSQGRFIVNPGSVGQPRDGDPRAAFAILDLGRGAIAHYRVAYPISRTQDKMLAAGLPARLIARLGRGW